MDGGVMPKRVVKKPRLKWIVEHVWVAVGSRYDIVSDKTVVRVLGVYLTKRDALLNTGGCRDSVVQIERMGIS
jgi:hypothetical protein